MKRVVMVRFDGEQQLESNRYFKRLVGKMSGKVTTGEVRIPARGRSPTKDPCEVKN